LEIQVAHHIGDRNSAVLQFLSHPLAEMTTRRAINLFPVDDDGSSSQKTILPSVESTTASRPSQLKLAPTSHDFEPDCWIYKYEAPAHDPRASAGLVIRSHCTSQDIHGHNTDILKRQKACSAWFLPQCSLLWEPSKAISY